MYIDTLSLEEDLKDYDSPRNKASRMNRAGEISRIRRGLYVRKDDPDITKHVLANVIYGPSYISFEYALSYHGLIPERVKIVSPAAFEKNKTKIYRTTMGEFHYFPLTAAVYPHGILRIPEGRLHFLIASVEKAVCDTLIKVKPVETIKELEILLYENFRIDREDIVNLDDGAINFLSSLYRRTNVKVLSNYLKKEKRYA